MKKFVEKFAVPILLAAVIFCVSGMSAYAMKIDGILTDSEWKNAPVFVLENQRNFDNKINSAVVKTVIDKKNGCIYLSVMTEFKKTGNLKDGGIKLSVNGAEPTVIGLGDGVVENGDYPVEANSDIDENSGCAFTEIAVHFKEGPSSEEIIKMIFVDLNGDESGVYTIDVKEKEPETTTTKTTTTKTTTTKTTTTKTTTTKTAKEKTSAEKTTKVKTSEDKSSQTEAKEKSTDKKSSENESSSKSEKTKDDFTFKKAVKSKTSEMAEKVKTTRLPKKVVKTSAVLSKSSDGSDYEDTPVNKIRTAEYEEEKTSENSGDSDTFYPEEAKNRKYTFIAIGAVSASLLAAAAVAAAAKSGKKDDE